MISRPRTAIQTSIRPCRTASGFGLIELVAVIAIIGIVAGLLLTVVSGGTETAREVQCVNNMRQSLAAWWDEVQQSPLSGPGASGFELPKVMDYDGSDWTAPFQVRNQTAVLRCPSKANPDGYGYGMNPLAGASYVNGAGFGHGYLLTPCEFRKRPASLIQKPSATIILAEAGRLADDSAALPAASWKEKEDAPWKPFVAFPVTDTWSGLFGAPAFGYDWGTTVIHMNAAGTPVPAADGMGWDGLVRAMPRHGGKSVVGFVDIHAASLPVAEVVDPEWGSDACLYDNQM